MRSNVAANDCTAVGKSSQRAATSGSLNVGVGSATGENNVTGDRNTWVGALAGRSFTGNSNSENVGIGEQAGLSITTGNENTMIGRRVGVVLSTGDNNTLIGRQAGLTLTTGSNNILIGSDIDASAVGVNNELNIGDLITGDLSALTTSLAGILILPKANTNGIKVELAAPTFPWRDIIGDQFTRNTGPTKPILATYNGAIKSWQFGDGDEAYLSFHIPHDYVVGTDIHLHIHWSQTSTTATGGTIDFKYFAIYAKGHNQASGSTFTSTPVTASFSSIDINDGGGGLNQYQQHLTEVIISASTPTAALLDRDDFEPDGVIELTLEMDTNSLTNSVSVLDPFIHFADIHYQSTNSGTKDKVPDFYT